jgi:hypothetical protein
LGITPPLADLIIGASAIELGYGVATSNLRISGVFLDCACCNYSVCRCRTKCRKSMAMLEGSRLLPTRSDIFRRCQMVNAEAA